MPCFASQSGTRILERLVLKPCTGNPGGLAIRKQLRLVRRNQMRHRLALPHVAVHPEPTIHCVNHPITPVLELAVRLRIRSAAYWHAGTPSCVAGVGSGDTGP